MMPDDIPHTDDKAKRKIHPEAIWCLLISLVPVALYVCLIGFKANASYFMSARSILMTGLFIISMFAQPPGICLGIYSLVQIRKDGSYCGKGYAIAGITISATTVILIGRAIFLMTP